MWDILNRLLHRSNQISSQIRPSWNRCSNYIYKIFSDIGLNITTPLVEWEDQESKVSWYTTF